MSAAPDTSLLAWAAINESGLVSRARLAVWRFLYAHGPATASELQSMEGCPRGAWKRLSELERQGIAATTVPRACRVTGQQATVWHALCREPRALRREGSNHA